MQRYYNENFSHFSWNLYKDFFLKIGYLVPLSYTKNVPNIEVCGITPTPSTTQSIKVVIVVVAGLLMCKLIWTSVRVYDFWRWSFQYCCQKVGISNRKLGHEIDLTLVLLCWLAVRGIRKWHHPIRPLVMRSFHFEQNVA